MNLWKDDIKIDPIEEIPSWLPDWRDVANYPSPQNMTQSLWNWEFFRRSTHYREFYNFIEYVKNNPFDCIKGLENYKTKEEQEDFIKYRLKILCFDESPFADPMNLPSPSLTASQVRNLQWTKSFMVNRKQEPTFFIPISTEVLNSSQSDLKRFFDADEKDNKFFMMESIGEHPSIDGRASLVGIEPYCEASFEELQNKNLSESEWEDTLSLWTEQYWEQYAREDIECQPDFSPYKLTVSIDLLGSIAEQLSKIRKVATVSQKILRDKGYLGIESRNHVEKFPNYLRVFDAKIRSVSNPNIAKILFPEIPNEYPDFNGNQTVENHHKAAMRLIEKKP